MSTKIALYTIHVQDQKVRNQKAFRGEKFGGPGSYWFGIGTESNVFVARASSYPQAVNMAKKEAQKQHQYEIILLP